MTEGEIFIEKRKYKRVEKSYGVRYKLMPGENTIESIKKEGSSHDISIGGVRIKGEIVGNTGDVIRLEFDIDSERTIVTFAEIKWIKDVDGGEFGVEFLALKGEDSEIINKVVNEE